MRALSAAPSASKVPPQELARGRPHVPSASATSLRPLLLSSRCVPQAGFSPAEGRGEICPQAACETGGQKKVDVPEDTSTSIRPLPHPGIWPRCPLSGGQCGVYGAAFMSWTMVLSVLVSCARSLTACAACSMAEAFSLATLLISEMERLISSLAADCSSLAAAMART